MADKLAVPHKRRVSLAARDGHQRTSACQVQQTGGKIRKRDRQVTFPEIEAVAGSWPVGRIEPGVAAARAAPPPTAAMRAGTGVAVRTGTVSATRAQDGIGTAVLGARSGREQRVAQMRRERIRVGSHGSLRKLPGFGLPDKTSAGTGYSTVAEDRGMTGA